MNITDVRIRKVETDNRMKAIASITLDDCFVIHDLRVIDVYKRQDILSVNVVLRFII